MILLARSPVYYPTYPGWCRRDRGLRGVTKEIIPPSDPQPSEEEIEEQRKAEEKTKRRAAFQSILDKAKKKTAAKPDQPEKREEVTGKTSGASPNHSPSPGNIQGVLGNRKVLKVPTIKDDSQKKGRVVVKICVNAEGRVTSSNYTMMGSTTNDRYLIGLAEMGAKGYLFSPSENPKECGNVIIDFQLK